MNPFHSNMDTRKVPSQAVSMFFVTFRMVFRIPGLFYVCECLPASIDVHHIRAWCLQRSEDNIGSLGTGVTGHCQLTHGSWEPSLSPLQEQKAFFSTEPSLQKTLRWKHQKGKVAGHGGTLEVTAKDPRVQSQLTPPSKLQDSKIYMGRPSPQSKNK